MRRLQQLCSSLRGQVSSHRLGMASQAFGTDINSAGTCHQQMPTNQWNAGAETKDNLLFTCQVPYFQSVRSTTVLSVRKGDEVWGRVSILILGCTILHELWLPDTKAYDWRSMCRSFSWSMYADKSSESFLIREVCTGCRHGRWSRHYWEPDLEAKYQEAQENGQRQRHWRICRWLLLAQLLLELAFRSSGLSRTVPWLLKFVFVCLSYFSVSPRLIHCRLYSRCLDALWAAGNEAGSSSRCPDTYAPILPLQIS